MGQGVGNVQVAQLGTVLSVNSTPVLFSTVKLRSSKTAKHALFCVTSVLKAMIEASAMNAVLLLTWSLLSRVTVSSVEASLTYLCLATQVA